MMNIDDYAFATESRILPITVSVRPSAMAIRLGRNERPTKVGMPIGEIFKTVEQAIRMHTLR